MKRETVYNSHTYGETVLIPEAAILKPCILYDHYRQSILDLVKSETYQKRIITPVALSENVILLSILFTMT